MQSSINCSYCTFWREERGGVLSTTVLIWDLWSCSVETNCIHISGGPKSHLTFMAGL